jgi:hypothetical protein
MLVLNRFGTVLTILLDQVRQAASSDIHHAKADLSFNARASAVTI